MDHSEGGRSAEQSGEYKGTIGQTKWQTVTPIHLRPIYSRFCQKFLATKKSKYFKGLAFGPYHKLALYQLSYVRRTYERVQDKVETGFLPGHATNQEIRPWRATIP